MPNPTSARLLSRHRPEHPTTARRKSPRRALSKRDCAARKYANSSVAQPVECILSRGTFNCSRPEVGGPVTF